jgi:hypothetical protein
MNSRSDRQYGEKAKETENLSKLEIAKLVRADIQTAIKAGELPRFRYWVRACLLSIRIKITGFEPKLRILSDARLRSMNVPTDISRWMVSRALNPIGDFAGNLTNNAIMRTNSYTPEAMAITEKLKAILWAYNYGSPNSALQADDFNCRFQYHVEWDWTETRAQEKRLRGELPRFV